MKTERPPLVFGSRCRCATLVPLRSMNLKICADCGKEHPWELAPGQQPLIGNNRADRRAAE